MTRRRDHERGAILPIALGAMLVLVVLAFGGFTMLRVVVARQEVQRAADAAVLVATTIVKHDGLPFDAVKQGRAETIARQNSTLSLEFHWEPVAETPDRVTITCRVTSKVQAPAFIFPSGFVEVEAIGKGAAPQRTLTEATKKFPKLVLVLDFSGSMRRPLGDDGSNFLDVDDERNSYHRLLHAVNMLFGLNYDIKYGLVIFATHVIDAVDIALGNLSTVSEHVNASLSCPGGNGCSTGSWEGLRRAGELFEASEGDEARYVLFVTDGQPNAEPDVTVTEGIAASKEEVEKLWDMGVTMFTIHMVNTSDQVSALREFMHGISGPPDDRGNPLYYADAASDEELEKTFKRFGAAIACQIGPLSPLPPDPKKMHVFVRGGNGEETPLLDSSEHAPPATNPGDLWDEELPFHDGNYFLYRGDSGIIFVTPEVCERVTVQKDPIIVRYASPLLTL